MIRRRIRLVARVMREAVMAKYLENFGLVLEPLIRRVVKEEVERGIVRGSRLLQRLPHTHLEAAEPSNLQLIFTKPLSLPIFTGSKIEDAENNLLQVVLVDSRNGEIVTPASPIRIEIVVVDGDFPFDSHGNWTTPDFNKRIVRERTGRRPLITGDVVLTLREAAATIGELTFTDNSSWIRCRQFRIGAKVATESYNGPRIREALTEAFMVKDHRGELYKKHYPPSLFDEVWRLERIGKDGAFHKKLSAEDINTVQDFLKLSSVDQNRMRRILGVGMSDRMWEGTIGHARTCLMGGEKLFMYRQEGFTIILNPICEVKGIVIDGRVYNLTQVNRNQRAYVQQLQREAYSKWDTLEETDGLFGGNSIEQNMELQINENEASSLCTYQQEIITSQYQIHPNDTQNSSNSTYYPGNDASIIQYW